MMKMVFQCIFLLIHPSLIVLQEHVCGDKAYFESFHGFKSNSTILYHVNVETTLKECMRACHLNYLCYRFNIEWTSQELGTGNCFLLNGGEDNGLVQSAHWSYYATCPGAMTYYQPTNQCYQNINQRTSWENAHQLCHELHPSAHLIDIQTEEEQRAVMYLLAEQIITGSVWTDGFREYDNTTVTKYHWATVEDVVTFTSWVNTNHLQDPKNTCITIMFSRHPGQWRSVQCKSKRAVLCKF